MNKAQFIDKIAQYVQKYAPQYGISVCSPIIAQAILESASGTSELAVNAHNYFGLKYRKGRCKTCVGVYHKVGSEQNADGSYKSSAMEWCKFSDMENGVIGYFDFTNISNYKNLKGITDPQKYLETIKADGYATSLKYVPNLMSVIKTYNLTKYDNKEEKKNMSNSPLVSYTKISPNKTSPRGHAIDTITIHCVVGQLSVEAIGNVFTPTSRQASSNYGIGSDGRIGMYVEEKDRSWCSSDKPNDNRAITIECASDTKHPYMVNSKVMDSLIKLVADICKRNGIKKLVWSTNKADRVGHKNGCNMTVHRDFAKKACPGDYLYNRHGEIADKVNALLGAKSEPTVTPKPQATGSYQVRVTANVLNIRKGAGTNYPVVGAIKDKGVYTIIEEKNGWGKLKSGAGWISLAYTKKV